MFKKMLSYQQKKQKKKTRTAMNPFRQTWSGPVMKQMQNDFSLSFYKSNKSDKSVSVEARRWTRHLFLNNRPGKGCLWSKCCLDVVFSLDTKSKPPQQPIVVGCSGGQKVCYGSRSFSLYKPDIVICSL